MNTSNVDKRHLVLFFAVLFIFVLLRFGLGGTTGVESSMALWFLVGVIVSITGTSVISAMAPNGR